MRRRRPPFTLVLWTLVALAALAIALAGRGSNHHPTSGQPPSSTTGSPRACVTTSAAAQTEDRSAIVISATVHAPVKVTEQAFGPNGIATVTREQVVSARVRGTEPVEVKRTSAVRVRACAHGYSTTAARTTALRAAYARALAAARSLASRQAAKSLAALIRNEYPALLAQAKLSAAARAHQLAIVTGTALAAQARAEARRRAGD